jgi:hypothetical protein
VQVEHARHVQRLEAARLRARRRRAQQRARHARRDARSRRQLQARPQRRLRQSGAPGAADAARARAAVHRQRGEDAARQRRRQRRQRSCLELRQLSGLGRVGARTLSVRNARAAPRRHGGRDHAAGRRAQVPGWSVPSVPARHVIERHHMVRNGHGNRACVGASDGSATGPRGVGSTESSDRGACWRNFSLVPGRTGSMADPAAHAKKHTEITSVPLRGCFAATPKHSKNTRVLTQA